MGGAHPHHAHTSNEAHGEARYKMYGSRTDKARGQRMRRSDEAYLRYLGNGRLKGRDERQGKHEAIAEQVTAMLNDDEPAMIRDCESVDYPDARDYPSWVDLDRMHGEALAMHEQWWEDRLDDPPLDLAPWEAEDARERDAQYDHAFGGYSDDPDCGDHSGCWLPFMRIEELRDTFGHNWLGNGFHIIDGNGIRRSK